LESEAQLVARVRSGDVEAFGELTARYERTLLAYAFGKLRDLQLAEDVIQTSAMLAFRQLESLHDQSKFGHWLLKIVQSQVVDVIRARKLPMKVPLDDVEDSIESHRVDPLWVESEYLLGLIELLSDDERLLIGMRYFDGKSMAEIAAGCSRPIGSVTKQLSRAIARLRSLTEMERGE